jgi:hypothetical protein
MAAFVQVFMLPLPGQSHLNSSGEDLQRIVVIPAAAEAFGFDAAVVGFLGLQQVQRDAGQPARPGVGQGWEKSCRRHPQEPKDHGLGRSRGGFTSKFHLATDGRGLPLTVEVTAGQVHDSTQVEPVLDGIAIPQPVGRPRKRPARLAGDKGYSCHRVRDWLRRHGIKPLIPHKDNEAARLSWSARKK